MNKSPVQSKTLWVNLVVAILAFFPGVASMFSPEQIMVGLSIINMVLRLVTKDKLGLE